MRDITKEKWDVEPPIPGSLLTGDHYNVVASDGSYIASGIPDEDTAKLIASLPTILSQLEKIISTAVEPELIKNISAVIEYLRDQVLPQVSKNCENAVVDTIYILKEINDETQKEKNIKFGGKCRVTIKENASKRTKEHIAQHEQPFTITKRDYEKNKIMLLSKDGWYGWFPINEININMYRD